VYDLIARENVATVVNPHSEDINSVCFANRDNSNIVFSGSDDTCIKVWDRRLFGRNQGTQAEGCLVGHREGVTHVSSKGDGVYLLSNAKD
jgi:WD repeat-containing protein 23